MLPAESDGTNLIGNTTLPNPSVMTLEVGTLILDVKIGSLVVGNVTLNDVTLVPGDNTFPMRGILDLKTIIKNLADVLKAEATAIKAGNLTIDAQTTSCIWNGTLVPYYTEILNELTLTAPIGIGDVLRNTISYLKSEGNLTDVLSNLTGGSGLNLSSLHTRSIDHARAPVDLSSFMRENLHIRDVLQHVQPDDQELIIKSLAAAYPEI